MITGGGIVQREVLLASVLLPMPVALAVEVVPLVPLSMALVEVVLLRTLLLQPTGHLEARTALRERIPRVRLSLQQEAVEHGPVVEVTEEVLQVVQLLASQPVEVEPIRLKFVKTAVVLEFSEE
jgi:hypothetical protein